MNPALIHHCNIMVQTALAQGNKPVVFLMNATTKAAVAETLLHAEKARRSAWERLKVWFRGERFELTHLLGVPVCENNHLPDRFVSLQVAQEGAGVVGAVENDDKPEMPSTAPENPFARLERVEAPAGDRAPTLNDLAASTSGQRPTPSAILIKALDGADELAGVVVIRVYPNQSLDMCLNVSGYEAQGILQKAGLYLMQRGQ